MGIQRDAKGRFKKGAYAGFGFEKGHIPLNKGEKKSIETIKKISDAKKEFWKDKKLSYEEFRFRENSRKKAERNTILKPCCENCGSTENLQRHHFDYNDPYKIVTLCFSCHRKLHNRRITLCLTHQ
jgi:hypothetical protein